MSAFRPSLRRGDLGQTLFFEVNCRSYAQTDGKEGDFVHKKTGEKLELKTDYYCMNATPNYFFEKVANAEKNTPGGPWRAVADGSKLFAYFYVKNLTYFVFHTEELVARLEQIIPNIKPTEVANPKYITVGYRVPRDMLKDIAKEVKLKVSKDG